MINRTNKTSICCIVFLDIIDYSKKTDLEQLYVKKLFNGLVSGALKDIAVNDRIILDTGDGAAITYMGSPEDALFMSMSIRDGILQHNASAKTPLFVRFGVNLGPVRIVNDINEQPNVIGDGINVAQRIMSFAKPNQILVSRSYFELTSRLTDEISNLFDYSGVHQDKHVREHEVYSVKFAPGQEALDQPPIGLESENAASKASLLKRLNWVYVIPSALILLALLVLLNLITSSDNPKVEVNTPSIHAPLVAPAKAKIDNNNYLTPSESVVDMTTVKPSKDNSLLDMPKVTPREQKANDDNLVNLQEKQGLKPSAAKKKEPVKTQNLEHQTENARVSEQMAPQVAVEQAPKSHETKPVQQEKKPKEKSTYVKNCSQAEISMNQCR